VTVWGEPGQGQYLRHHVGERDGGADLVIGCLPEQRPDRGQVGEDPVHVAVLLAVRIASAGGQSFRHDLRGRAEQDDQVEAGAETDLVLLAAGDEHDIGVLGV
jgi:hypothetical protein